MFKYIKNKKGESVIFLSLGLVTILLIIIISMSAFDDILGEMKKEINAINDTSYQENISSEINNSQNNNSNANESKTVGANGLNLKIVD